MCKGVKTLAFSSPPLTLGRSGGVGFYLLKELKAKALSVYARLTAIGMFADIYL